MHLPHPLPRWLAENKTYMMNLVHFYFLFFNFVKIGVVLGRMRAYVGVAWGPRTLPNLPMELICSEYVLVWVREQNRAFILDFWVICDFFPVGGHFLPFWSHIPLPPPRYPQNTLWNTPLEIFPSKYVLVWVREQNTAFIMDFWVICDFSSMGGHLSLFWLHTPPHTPHTPQNA